MRQVQRVQRQTRHGGQRGQLVGPSPPVGPTPCAGGWVNILRARFGRQVCRNNKDPSLTVCRTLVTVTSVKVTNVYGGCFFVPKGTSLF